MSYEETRKKVLEEAQADIDNAKKEYEEQLAEAQKNAQSEIKEAEREASTASNDAKKTAAEMQNPSSIERKPAETISSQGYNPDNKVPSTAADSTGGAGVSASNNAAQDRHHGSGLPKQEGVGEQAPDVGKDYGSTSGGDGSPYDETGNGYNPYDEKGNQTGKKEEPKDGEDKEKKGQTGEEGKQGGEGDQQDGKKNDPLKKEDDDPSKKKPESEGQPGDQTGDKKTPQTGDGQQGQQGQQSGTGKNPAESSGGEQDKGNGYGALKKKNPNGGTDMSDPTARARRNFNHNNASKNSGSSSTPKSSSKGGSSVPKKGGGGAGGFFKNALSKAGNGLKNAGKKLGNGLKDKSNGDGGQGGSNKFMGGLKNAIGTLIRRHPFVAAGLAIFVLFFIIMAMEEVSGGKGSRGSGKRTCTYELSGVTSTGTVELKDLKVELINCDGKADNYEVLATVDFEKYVLGVALAEAGASSPDEAIKAQIIAVRNFTLTRNSGMCPSNPSNCFHGYNESTGIIRMRACTNDQVYWDYTKDCPKIERPGQPTLYCEGVDGATDIWKKALSESRQQEVEALANSVMGEVLLDENGNVLKLGYQADETDTFIAEANAGKSYVEILEQVYGSNDYSSAKCSYGGVYDYGDYELTSEGDPILHEPLDQFLESQGTSLEEYNELIADNVDDAGYGTRAGVVAGSVTMVAELGNNYNVKVPYYWGGGHSSNDLTGEALAKWGSTQCHTYANDQHYNYCGLDCSGFVAWALNAGGFHCGPTGAGSFYKKSGAQKINLNPNSPVLQPGDILEYKDGSGGHAILVVGIDEENKQYICIEAMGNAHGVLFTRRSFGLSGYWGVDMEGFYNNPANLREPRD